MTDQNSITNLLYVLDQQLLAASDTTKRAYEAALTGEMNLAIGTLLPAQQHVEDAVSLLRVVLSLHRRSP